MSVQLNAAPRADLQGVRDDSTRQLVAQAEQIPTHLPLIWLLTERGDTDEAHVVSGDSAIRMYGRPTFVENSKFANHATVMYNRINGAGNAVMVQRLKPTGAATASLRLSLDVVEDDIPTYERGTDGKFSLDVNGDKIPTGSTVTGYKLKWVAGVVPAGEFGSSASSTGTMTNTTGDPSTLYPIVDIEMPSHGDWGNRVGLRFSAPTVDSSIPVNTAVIEDQLAYLFRLQIVEKPDERTSANVVETRFGERTLDFALKPGTYNRWTEQELYADERILPSYQDLDAVATPPDRGPVGRMEWYEDNIDGVLRNIHTAESAVNTLSQEDGAHYTINFFTGVNYNNEPYDTVAVEGAGAGGVSLSPTNTLYGSGGSDGDLSIAEFDSLVKNQAENFGDLDIKYLDRLRYPVSAVWDSGFSIETKKALFTVMGRRKDAVVVVGTQDAAQTANSPSEDSSIAVALRSAARLYPESDIHGTPACRAAVIAQSGKLISSLYRGILPLTHELAQKMANYMGAGTQVWDNSNKPDVYPNNEIRFMKDVTNAYKPASVRALDWANGLVWAQSSGRRTLFFPALQTVYDNDTSVMNSLIVAFIASDLNKVADRVWRDLTGRTDLSAAQFLERSDEAITNYVRNKYDGRVIIEPRTFFTDVDAILGYSWSTEIKFYAPTMRTVNHVTIVSERSTAFAG